jgi:hypothetical protein
MSEVVGFGAILQLTMQLGPEQVGLTADVRFRRELDVEHPERVIGAIEARIRTGELRRNAQKKIYEKASRHRPRPVSLCMKRLNTFARASMGRVHRSRPLLSASARRDVPVFL